jgi:alpha-amylase
MHRLRSRTILAFVALALAAAACGLASRAWARPPAARAAAPAAGPLEWARGATFYEIFVRSFADSDGDGIGDLRGLTARLDYLNDGDPSTTSDLGIECIWLMPIFASPSYHGYDTVDYRTINPQYGTTADFDSFLGAAHARGIHVIVDLVVNHTSSTHPWFVESSSSPQSPKRDWYVWRADNPGWRQPWGGGPTWHQRNGAYFYGIFGGGMPDLNYENPEVREEVKSIASFWLARGVDGFRLDAARHLMADGPGELQNNTPGTHAFWKEFAAHVRATAPRALLVGENWTSTENIAPYFGSTATVAGGDELPMSFDFPLASAILQAVRAHDASAIVATLADIARLYPAGVLDATFITNHDTPRVASELGSDPARLRSAAALLLTLPGSPFLYYGEELGLVGNKPDPSIRTPMPWDDGEPGGGFTTGTPWRSFAAGRDQANVAAQFQAPGSLLAHYRHLIHLRASSPALRRGTIQVLDPGAGNGQLLAFIREAGGERMLVVHNLGVSDASAGPWSMRARAAELVLATADGATARIAGGIAVTVPAGGSAIWRLR